jgi:CheY-like chemotaxis protein
VTEKTESAIGKLRILIVDDETDLLELLRLSLGKEFEIVTATNGMEALQKLDLSEPDFVICDVSMPVMDGFKTVEAIRRHPKFNDIPVFFLTALRDKEKIKQTYAVGGNLYLQKPVDPVRLIGAIDAYVEEFDLRPRPKSHTPKEVEELSSSEAMSRELQSGVEVRELASAALVPEKLRIMAIDNDHTHLDWYARVLSPYCDFIPCDESVAAMEKIVRYNPDILIMNSHLENISGLQLARFIKGLCTTPLFEVLFCSNEYSMQLAADVTRLTGNPLLSFPIKEEQLLGTIQTILHKPSFRLKKKKTDLDSLKLEESLAEQKKKEAARKLREISSTRRRYESIQRFIDQHLKDGS